MDLFAVVVQLPFAEFTNFWNVGRASHWPGSFARSCRRCGRPSSVQLQIGHTLHSQQTARRIQHDHVIALDEIFVYIPNHSLRDYTFVVISWLSVRRRRWCGTARNVFYKYQALDASGSIKSFTHKLRNSIWTRKGGVFLCKQIYVVAWLTRRSRKPLGGLRGAQFVEATNGGRKNVRCRPPGFRGNMEFMSMSWCGQLLLMVMEGNNWINNSW